MAQAIQTTVTDDELDDRFGRQSRLTDGPRFDHLRMEFRFAAQALKDLTPPGPDQRRALNALEEAMLIAIAAVHVADARSLAQIDRDRLAA